jgi:hypothetical protein
MNDTNDHTFHKHCSPETLNAILTHLKDIIDKIKFDGQFEPQEALELSNWHSENLSYRRLNPFNEILPMVDEALEDGILKIDELTGINWFLERSLSERSCYNEITGDLEYLQGLVHGILADGLIKEDEIESLRLWLNENEHLAGCYPYDEIYSLMVNALKDGKFNEEESEVLKAFFAAFSSLPQSEQIRIKSTLKETVSTVGICTVAPVIHFRDQVFSFVGQSTRTNRKELAIMIEAVGGVFSRTFTSEVNYLIYGAAGNQCWAFSCFGKIIEEAMALRKQGDPISIIHENDFWDRYQKENLLHDIDA